MNKKTILTVLITALVMIGGTIGVMIMLNGNNGSTFTNSLKDGHYIQDTDNEDKIKLDIDGNKALVTRSGTSYIWTIDKSKKSFIFKEDDENKKVNYEMIADKLVINYDGTRISFIKSTKKTTGSNAKSETKPSQRPTSSESKLTVDIVKKEAEKGIGLAPKLANDLMDDLQGSTKYEDGGVVVSVEFVDADGNTIEETDEGYKVDEVLSVNEKYDDMIEVTFLVSKK